MDARRVLEQAGLRSLCSRTHLCLGLGCSLCSYQPQLRWLGEGGWQGRAREGTGALLASFKLYILMLWTPSFQSVPRSVRGPGRRQVT